MRFGVRFGDRAARYRIFPPRAPRFRGGFRRPARGVRRARRKNRRFLFLRAPRRRALRKACGIRGFPRRQIPRRRARADALGDFARLRARRREASGGGEAQDPRNRRAARAEGAEIFRKCARRHQALHSPHRRPVQARRAPACGRGGRRAKGGRAGGIRLGFHARTALLRPVHVLRRRRFPARKALASLGASGVRRRIFQLGAHGGNFEAARGKGADSRARGFCGSRPRAAHGAQRGEGARVR